MPDGMSIVPVAKKAIGLFKKNSITCRLKKGPITRVFYTTHGSQIMGYLNGEPFYKPALD